MHHSKHNVGYVIPEFPGQTHIGFWREFSYLRDWGIATRIFSTRPPDERVRARHRFATSSEPLTSYLWPAPTGQVIQALLWAVLRHPVGFARCLKLAWRLPIEGPRRVLRMLKLIVPACLLARQVRHFGITHLHAHTCANGAILCMLVQCLIGTPYSLTLNADISWWGGAMHEKLSSAQFTAAVSQWLLDQIHRDHPDLRPEQAILGRVGVDTREWSPASERSHERGTPPRIVTVARLHEGKGHLVLLEALEQLHGQGWTIEWRIAGAGDLRAELEQRIAAAGLSDHVHLLGSLSEEQIRTELQTADLFVLPSHAEALGVVYMEAMAMEVASIGTSVGGVGEIIQSGDNGILVPAGDPAALADAIRTLLEDDTLRRRMALGGRQTIRQKFDSRVGAAAMYERITGEAPPAN